MEQFDLEELMRRIDAKISRIEEEKKEEVKEDLLPEPFIDDYSYGMDLFDDFDIEKNINKTVNNILEDIKENVDNPNSTIEVTINGEPVDIKEPSSLDRIKRVLSSLSPSDTRDNYSNKTSALVRAYKELKNDATEYIEAKKLVKDFMDEYNLNGISYWEDLLDECIPDRKFKPTYEINISKEDYLEFDNATLYVNKGEAENLVLYSYLDSFDNLEVHYEIKVNDRIYRSKLYFEGNIPKNAKVAEECPYNIELIKWGINSNGDIILTFNINKK